MGNKIVLPSEQEDFASEQAPITPAPVVTPTKAPTDKAGMMKIGRILVELLLLAAVVYLSLWGYGLYTKNQDLQKQVDTLNSNPVIAEQRKTNELVQKVSSITQLPTGETPTAAQVLDPAALIKQYPFFQDVQKGDQILFFTKSGKVFVFRPSTNKIVKSGPLTVNQTSTGTSTN